MDNNEQIALDCLDIAKDITPKKSGNWAFNATNLRFIPNGFVIYTDETRANYAKIVNANQGVYSTIRTAIGAYLTNVKNGHINNLNATRERLAELSPDNPARQATLLKSLQSTIKEL